MNCSVVYFTVFEHDFFVIFIILVLNLLKKSINGAITRIIVLKTQRLSDEELKDI